MGLETDPNISHRFASASKHNMIDFMMQLEATMLELSKIVSTVVEDRKSKVKWIAEVEISAMAKVFAAPKSEDGNTCKKPSSIVRRLVPVSLQHRTQSLLRELWIDRPIHRSIHPSNN